MSARVPRLENAAALTAALDELLAGIRAGRIQAVAIVAGHAGGGLEPVWWSRMSGTHAGTVLRGMVAYLAAVMDAEALAPSETPIASGGGEDTWTP